MTGTGSSTRDSGAIGDQLTGVRAVSIPVGDQLAALSFYTDVLGFRVLRNGELPGGRRWIELVPGGAADPPGTVVTLEPAGADIVRGDIIIRFETGDAAAAHAALSAAGVDTDELLQWPGVPPMFGFRDRDGNALSVTENPFVV